MSFSENIPLGQCAYWLYPHTDGTPHIQAVVTFKRAYRLAALKKLHPNAHWEVALAGQDFNYVRKLDSEIIVDIKQSSQGHRKDLDLVMEAIKANKHTLKELRLEFPSSFAKYSLFLNRVHADYAVPDCPVIDLYDWQEYIVFDILGEPAHSRHVHLFIDPIGGGGKTTFMRYLMNKFKDVEVFSNGKSCDILYAVCAPKIAIFDFARSSDEFRPWSAVEQIKNGLVFSSKYDSITKSFAIPHVIIFTNSDIENNKLSNDRICRHWISQESATSESFVVPPIPNFPIFNIQSQS